MKLSVILISYDMGREIPRTLQGLARTYQTDAQHLDYEVLLVDNGSPQPLDPASWSDTDVPVRLIRVEDAHHSPAQAINLAFAQAQGDVVCLMIDGAHLLTPGVFKMALANFGAFDNPVVAIRYFYLGKDEQTVSVDNGYTKQIEDRLLERIEWPSDGYRLYENCAPLRSGAKRLHWLNRIFESNCLFLKRSLFEELGGADERFDLPGGGFLNIDIFKRAMEAPGVTPVQVIGEGSFHQLHGGTTTNSSGESRDAKLVQFRQQYRDIRGHEQVMANADFTYMGHLPTVPSNITAMEKRRVRKEERSLD
ncbi:MAG: glycosyltransferase involved in cell wall biosynthesis [Bacteroidia bacterium]|jgi:glycosyltransferase involved in cell wall biosynthesis